MQKLFGGSNSQSQSGPVDATAPDVSAFRQQIENAFTSAIAQSNSSPTGGYTGPLTAGMSPEEQAQYSAIASGAGDPTQAARQKYLTDTLSGNNLPGAPGGNPFLQQSIADTQATNLQGLTDTLGRVLPGKFTAAGQFVNPNGGQAGGKQGGSSPFDTAAALATGQVAQANAGIASSALNNAWNTGVQAQTAAAPISQQEITAATQKLQDLALPRLIQDEGITRGLDLHNQAQSNLVALLGAANGVGGLQKVASESTQSGDTQGGLIPGIAGTVLLPSAKVG